MDYTAMGERIRKLRRQKELTQASLAEEISVSTSFVGHVERGTRIISLETFVRLCRALEADPGWLLGLSENSKDFKPKEELLKLLERSTELAQRI